MSVKRKRRTAPNLLQQDNIPLTLRRYNNANVVDAFYTVYDKSDLSSMQAGPDTWAIIDLKAGEPAVSWMFFGTYHGPLLFLHAIGGAKELDLFRRKNAIRLRPDEMLRAANGMKLAQLYGVRIDGSMPKWAATAGTISVTDNGLKMLGHS